MLVEAGYFASTAIIVRDIPLPVKPPVAKRCRGLYCLCMADNKSPFLKPMNVPRPVNNPLAAQLWDNSYQAGQSPFLAAVGAQYEPNRHQSLVAQALAHSASKAAYPGNIDINARPVVPNPDGSFSTEESLSFQDENGFEIVIPTVVNGKHLTPDEAINHYYQTAEQLGVFNNPTDAERFADKLHLRQEQKYSTIARALMGK